TFSNATCMVQVFGRLPVIGNSQLCKKNQLRLTALRSGLGPSPCHPREGLRPVIAPAPSPYDCHPRPVNGHDPLAGAVAAAAFSNDRPATALGKPGGLNANRFPVGSTVTLPTKGGPVSCARVRI